MLLNKHLYCISEYHNMNSALALSIYCTLYIVPDNRAVELLNFITCPWTSKLSGLNTHLSNQGLLAQKLTFFLFLKENMCCGCSLEVCQ